MKQVKRTSKAKFETEVEDKITEGYQLVSKTTNMAMLKRGNFGKAFWHIILFVFTVWWTLGIGNGLYLLYSYCMNSDEVIIKVD